MLRVHILSGVGVSFTVLTLELLLLRLVVLPSQKQQSVGMELRHLQPDGRVETKTQVGPVTSTMYSAYNMGKSPRSIRMVPSRDEEGGEEQGTK